MLTAPYMAYNFKFRPEYDVRDSSINCGLDLAVQPLGAPVTIAAGGSVRVKAMSYDGEYGLPLGILREE